jgi:putative transposase
MQQQLDSLHKTFTYKLMPTPAHERALEHVVWRCRELYNAGLHERKAAWERRSVAVNFAMQSAQLPTMKEVRPEYREINAQVMQDVLHRLDRAFQSFFRPVKNGEQPGYPRFQGRDRYHHSFTYPQVGEHGGVVLDGGILGLTKIGRIPLRLHRPLQGTPKDRDLQPRGEWVARLLLLRGGTAAAAAHDGQSDRH